MTGERQDLGIHIGRQDCPYCKSAVEPDQPKLACDGCMAWHHAECWTAHTVCSACGFETPSGPSAPVAIRPKVVRLCSIAGCLDPATVVEEGVEWCRGHLDIMLAEQVRAHEGQVQLCSGFSYVGLVFAVIAAAAFLLLPRLDHVNVLLGSMAAVCGVMVLGMRWSLRRQSEKKLETLKATQERHRVKDAKAI